MSVESVAGELLRKAIVRLQTKGWRKHALGGERGPNCLAGAVYHESIEGDLIQCKPYKLAITTLIDVIQAQYPQYAWDSVVDLNDWPKTTLKDVIAVAEKAAIRLEELDAASITGS